MGKVGPLPTSPLGEELRSRRNDSLPLGRAREGQIHQNFAYGVLVHRSASFDG